MASLFADLRSGFRMPDVQMNKGPLPTTAGGPAGSDGTADGRYNFNGELLSGITPYAYGEAARMGSDRNYQQIPHRIQKIIPPLYLPKNSGKPNEPKIEMTHSVDQGDVAFAINLGANNQHLMLAAQNTFVSKNDSVLASFTPFCNLATVNYILAGLWRYGDKEDSQWQELSKAFNCGNVCGYTWNKATDTATPVLNTEKIERVKNIHRLLRMCLMPFGICAGSEHQGGKHELNLAPIVAAVNYVTVMTIDGQNRDLVNFWRANTLSAGDELIYRLDYRRSKDYTLNHYYKNVTHASFDDTHFPGKLYCPQLVPDVYTPFMTMPPAVSGTAPVARAGSKPKYAEFDNLINFFTDAFSKQALNELNYRWRGYWRIGQLMHHRGAHKTNGMEYNCDTDFLTGGLLQVTFAPVWRQFDFDSASMTSGGYSATSGTGPSTTVPIGPAAPIQMIEFQGSKTEVDRQFIMQASSKYDIAIFTQNSSGTMKCSWTTIENSFVKSTGFDCEFHDIEKKEQLLLFIDPKKLHEVWQNNTLTAIREKESITTAQYGFEVTKTIYSPITVKDQNGNVCKEMTDDGGAFTAIFINVWFRDNSAYRIVFSKHFYNKLVLAWGSSVPGTASTGHPTGIGTKFNQSGFLGGNAALSAQPMKSMMSTISDEHEHIISSMLHGLPVSQTGSDFEHKLDEQTTQADNKNLATAQHTSKTNADERVNKAAKTDAKHTASTSGAAQSNSAEAANTPAASKVQKTQAAQSLGQNMKSMLTGGRGKGKASSTAGAASAQSTDTVPDDPMNDA
jgi:hypothetical protein